MKKVTASSAMILLAVFLGVATLGCGPERKAEGVPPDSTYCDDSGCYQCSDETNCWPIDRPACENDGECEAGDICTTYGCQTPCENNSVCGDKETCQDGLCTVVWPTPEEPNPQNPTTCSADEDCAEEDFCDQGVCTPRCKSDDDCEPGFVCSACGKCQAEGVPATCGFIPDFCSETISCGEGKTCVDNRCHFQCEADANCPVGQLCQDGLCADDPAPANPACVLDLDCSGGVCINGYCHDTCEGSAQCDPLSLCMMGVCQPDYYPAQ